MSGRDEWPGRYAAGETTRQIAATDGVHESTVRKHLVAAGATLRPRGARAADIDPDRVGALRDAGLTWDAIGRQLGASKHTLHAAHIRAGGELEEPTSTPIRRPLRSAETSRLLAAVRAVPSGTGGRLLDLTSAQGQRLITMVGHLYDDGVQVASVATIVGVSVPTIRRWLHGEIG